MSGLYDAVPDRLDDVPVLAAERFMADPHELERFDTFGLTIAQAPGQTNAELARVTGILDTIRRHPDAAVRHVLNPADYARCRAKDVALDVATLEQIAAEDVMMFPVGMTVVAVPCPCQTAGELRKLVSRVQSASATVAALERPGDPLKGSPLTVSIAE